jgi:hypothetical protein
VSQPAALWFAVVATQATQRERVCPQADWVFMHYKLANSKPSACVPKTVTIHFAELRWDTHSFALWCPCVRSEHTQFCQASTFFGLWCLRVRCEHTPSFDTASTLFALCCDSVRCQHPHSFAEMLTHLRYGVFPFVRSTPSLGRPCTFFALRCLGIRCERPPASLGHPLFRHMMSWRPF